MTESQFFTIASLICLMGILFASAFAYRGKYNPIRTDSKPKSYHKVFGWIFIGLATLQMAVSIIWFLNIQFPESALNVISANSIVHDSSTSLMFGYPTLPQRFCLSMFAGVFACMGFALYFLKYKPSPTKNSGKIGKSILYLIAWILYVNSWQIHYFDFWDVVKPLLYFIILGVLFRKSKSISVPEMGVPMNNTDMADSASIESIHIDSDSITTNNIKKDLQSSSTSNINKAEDKTRNYFKLFAIIGFCIIIANNLVLVCFQYSGIGIEHNNYRNQKYSSYNSDGYRNSVTITAPYLFDGYIYDNIARARPFRRLPQVINEKFDDYNSGIIVFDAGRSLMHEEIAAQFLGDLYAYSELFYANEFCWNGRNFGRPSFHYWREGQNGDLYCSVVFTYYDKIILILSHGNDSTECAKMNQLLCSAISLYDYNSAYSINEDTFTGINLALMLVALALFVTGFLLQIKGKGGWKTLPNNQAKVIAYLNLFYLFGWAVFAIFIGTDNYSDYFSIAWPLYIVFWGLITLLFSYILKTIDKPYSEFYLIPNWVKSILSKYGLNTKLYYRLVLLLIFWPFFYLAILPVFGFIPSIYFASMSAISSIALLILKTIKWIKYGKGIKVE